MTHFAKFVLAGLATLLCGEPLLAQRQAEKLGRGLVAMRTNSTQVYLGWRLLGNDPANLAFNLYRTPNGGAPVKLNTTPLTASTNYLDTPPLLASTAYSWSVRPVLGGVEVADSFAHPLSAPAALPVNPTTRQYTPVPIQPTPDGALKVGFCWVGDLDGDGEYDFVIIRHNHLVADSREFLEGYKRDGTLLWRMNMGPNSTNHYHIEPGSSTLGNGHGDNATVYDMDGDGKAEVIVRTANGVVFGNGATLVAANNSSQFISIINGETGVEMARDPVPNPYLSDGPLNGHMGILYLDGQRPSVFLEAKNRRADNGFQGLTTAWDYRNGVISRRWSWDADTLRQHAPEGHQVRLGDPDNDGKDEFLDIGYGIDDNGQQLFNIPEVVHGDRFHLADIDPDRPGLETYLIQQNNGSGLATALIEAGTGKFIKKWYAGGVVDVGRGLAADIDPAHKGLEMFSTQANIYNSKGDAIHSSRPFPPEAVWWDGNLSREFLATVGSTAEAPAIARFDANNPASQSRIYTIYNQTPPGVYWAYGGRAPFWGDIQGDWREEVVVVANDHSELRIYTTTISAPNRLYTLMHNPQYRIQTTTKGYVQASYVDYYLGDGMTPPPPPPMVDAKLAWRGGTGASTWDNGVTASFRQSGVNSVFLPGDSVRFDIGADSSTPVALVGTLQPSALTVYSPKSQVLDGSNGSLVGTMTFLKAGAGSVTISGDHIFTGATTVWDGALILNGTLQGSPVTVWGGTFGGLPAAGLTGGRIGGSGTFAQPVTVGYRAAVTPGTGMGNAGVLYFGNGLTAQDGSYFALDLSAAASDRIAITGNLNLSGKVGIVIKALGAPLPAGTYTLATYTGSLVGNTSNFTVVVPPGTPYTLSAAAGSVVLTVPVTRAPAAVVWRGTGSAWDLASSQNWTLGGAPAVFVSGDSVTFNGTGSASASAVLTGALPVSGLTVDSPSDYTFSGSGSISGGGGLSKSGSGTLTVNTTNDFTGPTTITGGVLAVTSLGDAGTPSSIGAATAAATNLTINGGTLRLTGAQTNTNRSLTLGTSGGTLDVATGDSSLQISGAMTGSGGLAKTGPGTLILASANTYTGGTNLSAGTIYLAGATANSSGLGSGIVTLAGGTLTMANVQASETAAWNLVVPAGAIGRLNADGRCSLTGTLTGGGTFDYYTPFVRTDLRGNWSAFAGQINVIGGADGGEMRVTNTFGFANAAIRIGASGYVYYNIANSSPALDIGELTGDATSGLGGGPTATRTVTWRVGGKNSDATFDGAIVNGAGPTAITKLGSGIWTLAGTSTHTGSTTVSAGTLRILGSTTGSTLTIQPGAALSGSGTVTGDLSVQGGGILEHGGTGATPLAIVGNVTFGSTAIVRPPLGVDLGTGTYTVLTYSGTLAGTPAFSWQPPAGSTLVGTVSASSPGLITVTLTQQPGGAGNLAWKGIVSSVWDNATANWTDGTSDLAFATGATVTFPETGNATSAINLALDLDPKNTLVDAAKNYTFSGSGKIIGTGSLVKAGTGTLNLTNAHTYSGGTYLNGGTVFTSTDVAMSSIGTGPIVFQGGTLQQLDASATYSSANYALQVAAGQSGTLRCDSRMDLAGTLIGGGTLNLYVPWVRFKTTGDWSGFSGNIQVITDADGGLFRIANASGLPSASVSLAASTTVLSFLNYTHTMPLGSLSGAVGSFLSGSVPDNNIPPVGTVVTWQIGGKNLDSTFSGVIQNGNGSSQTAVRKTGSATLTLTAVNTYTGPTTVAAGRLSVMGSLASPSIEVAPAGTLSGTGTLAGAVVCNGTLAPGSPVGTLTLASGLALSPASVLAYDLGTVSDRTHVTGALTLAGTLHVTATPGFGPGSYTLITYTGTLTDDDGLQLGTLPPGHEATISTATPGQVRLVVTRVLTPYEEWQISHFGSTTNPDASPTADPDGDSTSNETEFRLGLDPKNGSSSFKATGSLANGEFTLTWPSAAGLVFEIRRSASLDGPWELLDTRSPIVSGPASFTDTAPLQPRGFYRIALLP